MSWQVLVRRDGRLIVDERSGDVQLLARMAYRLLESFAPRDRSDFDLELRTPEKDVFMMGGNLPFVLEYLRRTGGLANRAERRRSATLQG